MYFVWCAAAFAIGIGLGLCFGMLLRAVIANWENAATASKIFMAVMLALFGGGAFGVTALFARLVEADNAAFYLLGLGIGLTLSIVGLFFPTHALTLKAVKGVIELSDALREKVPNIDDRASLVASQFMRAREIEREAKIGEQELAQRLERAADAIAEEEDQSGRGGAS